VLAVEGKEMKLDKILKMLFVTTSIIVFVVSVWILVVFISYGGYLK
jgi:hypothetical protein